VLDHVTIGVTDFTRAAAFYDAALAPLGLVRSSSDGARFAGYGEVGVRPYFWIGRKTAVATGMHVAFVAPDRPTVQAFHRAALAAGGLDSGGPGLRPQYHSDYYAAFVLDPDGHKIEAVCRSASGGD
jgi:catechol 2,3-dioxygenase-like lactoylglutathione lyase family enzyme